MVPFKVQTELGCCVGKRGSRLNRKGKDCVGTMPEFRLEATPGLYDVLAAACATLTSIATCGGNCAKAWCAQIAPGGRPSIGPVPPPSLTSTGWVVGFASAVGAGFNVETALRGRRSKRGIADENAATPKVGLAATPVGTSKPKHRVLACAAFMKGFRPPIGARSPALVNKPHFTRSRRDTLRCDRAFMISARFLRAFTASRNRLPSECSVRKKRSS